MSVHENVMLQVLEGIGQLMVVHGEGSGTPKCMYYSDLCPWSRQNLCWKFELVKGQAQFMKCISLLLG